MSINANEKFVLLDAATNEIVRISELTEQVIYNPGTAELYLKDLRFVNNDNNNHNDDSNNKEFNNNDNNDCDDRNDYDNEELYSILRAMFLNRTEKWEEISIDGCSGCLSDLLSIILEQSSAPVYSLLLDSIVIDEEVSLVLQTCLTRANPKLKSLQIVNCDITYFYVEPMFHGLEINRSIQTLSFFGCTFDQSAIIALAASLQMMMCHGNIKSLDVSSCGFSDQQMAYLLNGLCQNNNNDNDNGGGDGRGLERLNISGKNNHCSTETYAAIAKFLESTNALKTMSVTLPYDAEIPSLNISKKRRRVSKHRNLIILYTRRNPLNDNGVEFSCSVSCQLKV